MVKLLSSIFYLLLVVTAQATIHTAASANSADIQAKVDIAVNGDTINVPAGTVTWTSGVNCGSKAISIIGVSTASPGTGAGTSSTIINNTAGMTAFSWLNTGANFFRLSGFRFNNQDAAGSNPLWVETVKIGGPATSFRVDNCYFNKGDVSVAYNTGRGPYGTGNTFGVIDHCTMVNMKRPAFPQNYRAGENDSQAGGTSWATPPLPGSANMVFWENNLFEWNASLTDTFAQTSLHGIYGGAACFRYNISNGWIIYIDAHGDSPGQSTHYYEVYNNTFNENTGVSIAYPGGTSQGEIMFLRGGIHLVHDNIFNGKSPSGPSSVPCSLTWYWPGDVRVIGYQNRDTFFWNNTWNRPGASPVTVTDQSLMVQVKESNQTPSSPTWSRDRIRNGIEYHTRAPASGDWCFPYTTYTYPHPLVLAATGPGSLTMTAASQSISEGAGSVTISVSRVNGSAGAVGVSYATSNGTATSGSDYTSASGTLSWADGDTAVKTFNVTITQDAATEGNESFNATISSATGGASLLAPTTNVITIVDDEAVTPPLMGGLTFEAEAGAIDAPYVSAGGLVSQSVVTPVVADGGRIRWRVTIPSTGNYTVSAGINAADAGSDSLFIDWDQEPVTPTAIWDVLPLTTGVQQRTANWRGAGTSAPEFVPKMWSLTSGIHTLYVRGRESNTILDNITVTAEVVTVATPVISLASGSYFGTQNVTITTATSGADIRYTTNGSTPTAASTLYTGAIPLSAGTTLKAIGIKSGSTDSGVATEVYEIDSWTSDSSQTFENIALGVSTGAFDYTFTVTPAVGSSYYVMMLAPGVVGGSDDWAIAIWFDPASGEIKARNGDFYSAVNVIPHVAGNTYTIHITGDVATHTYSATVNGTILASGYGFRTSQNACTQLEYLALYTQTGSALTVPVTESTPPTPVDTINATNLIIGAAAVETEGIPAASASRADVQAAVDSAVDGDTVLIPNGSATWTTGISTTKQIIIRAANYTPTPAGTEGAGATTRNVTITNACGVGVPVIQMTSGNSSHVGVGGIHFAEDGTSDSITRGPHVRFDGIGTKVPLIFDCLFDVRSRSGTSYEVAGIVIRCGGGVMWNCYIRGLVNVNQAGEGCMVIRLDTGGGGREWNTASTMGSLDTNGDINFYVEDTTVKNAGPFPDADDHARFVARHFIYDGSWGTTHGPTSSWGGRHVEFYDGVFTVSTDSRNLSQRYYWIRAGTGVFVDNVVEDAFDPSDYGNPVQLALAEGLAPTPPYMMPRQPGSGHNGTTNVSDPMYIWNQTGEGSEYVWTITPGFGWDTFIQLNRDIFISGAAQTGNYLTATGAKPGYAKFTYPHPMRAVINSGTTNGNDINLTGYALTFSDEFDTLSVTETNPKGAAKWYWYPPYGASGGYSDSYWTTSGTMSVSGGILTNTAYWHTGLSHWVSGCLSSMDGTGAGFAQKYGYFSARVRMPNAGQGAWPQFWVFGTDAIADGNTGQRLELDIFEWYGVTHSNAQDVLQSQHEWNGDGSQGAGSGGTWGHVPGGDPVNTWHIYGLLIQPDFITWYIDGLQTFQRTTPTAYHTNPMFVMIDYALGGGWALTGEPFASHGPSSMLVDWVRVYSLP